MQTNKNHIFTTLQNLYKLFCIQLFKSLLLQTKTQNCTTLFTIAQKCTELETTQQTHTLNSEKENTTLFNTMNKCTQHYTYLPQFCFFYKATIQT